MPRPVKVNLCHQQLRDFCACVRSQLAEIEAGLVGEGLDDAEGRMHIIRDQIDYVLLRLPRKALQ